MVRLETKKVRWWWAYRPIRYRTVMALGEGQGDQTGYLLIFAIDDWGTREQVGQPVHPSQVRRLLSQYEAELGAMSEMDWFAKHGLRRLRPSSRNSRR